MKPFANIPLNIPRSGIRVIMDLAGGDKDIIHLEIGQPDFQTPENIVEATCRYVRQGYTKYTPNSGLLELREAAADYFKKTTGVKTKAENIIITPGAIFSIATAFLCLIAPEDEVLLPDPGWPNYSMSASIVHANPVYYKMPPEKNFLPDIEELNRLVTAKTKLLVICSPSNPTGQVYDEELMSKILEFARKKDLYVLSDEIYSEFVYDGQHVSALSYDTDERTLIINGMSKSYSMTGYRVGFTRAREDYIEIATKIQEAFVACVSGFSQLASAEGLNGPQYELIKMKNSYKIRRDLALDVLKKYGLYKYTPNGAFYLLIDISSTGMDSMDFAMKLLDEEKVAVTPGNTFGEVSSGYIRVSFASSKENIIEGLKRICQVILRNRKRNI